ncbi:MAG: serine/threonine protein kinase [Chloroflexi bacterium]|nr:serine/threonine protein kinase [Chloroflexota bacterium]
MATPTVLNDRYQLQQTLGTGGMALVYKAKDLMLERHVAVKVLREDFSQDVAFRERFRQEAKAAANLSHPNIVTVHDFGLDQGHLFIVMEYMSGQDLKTYIKQKERFSVAETLELMIQACQGVGYAHRAGLVHCDIKPHNMLVTPEGRLKVTDFGIARALSTISPEEHNDVVWGSPHYFSPEQASGLPPSPASDVYSLGVILYEMLTGRVPFVSSSSSELARMHREETPVSPRTYNTSIPSQLEEIILKVLSKEPAARYRTADQLGRLLQGLYQSNPSLKRSVPFVYDTFQALSNATGPHITQTGQQVVKPYQPPQVPVGESQRVIRPGVTESEIATAYQPDAAKQPKAVKLRKGGAQPRPSAPKAEEEVDWKTWLLGIAAFASLFGLIPFWLYVYTVLKP